MFQSRTVFVLGAGASSDVGMPLGSKLTGQIANLLSLNVEYPNRATSGDQNIANALMHLAREEAWASNEFYNSARAVAEAMELAQSIDTFLESHSQNREFVQLGKMGIARAIAIAESQSALRPLGGGKPFALKGVANSWYYSLARQLFTGISATMPEIAFENVDFIVFNYDRCIEVFLARAAQVYFRLSEAAAQDLVKKVTFVHPYGTLGSPFEGMPDYVPFGHANLDLVLAANRIRTFSESSEAFDEIQDLILSADTVIFLGFAFHEQNMELLDVSKHIGLNEPIGRRVYATTMEMSASDERVVRGQIARAVFGPGARDHDSAISTIDGDCEALFRAYWRSLTS